MSNNQIVLSKVSGDATIYGVVAPAGLENGNIVVLGAQNSNSTYACAANTAITDAQMVLVMAVPLEYKVSLYAQNDYTIATGDVVRAYVPYVGLSIAIPASNITATATLTKGYAVVPKAGALPMECKTTAGGTEAIAFVIDELFTKAGVSMAKIRCIKA